MNDKLISIIVPVFNRAAEVSELLESIADQITDNIETVIVDDGSTDELDEIIDQFRARMPLLYLKQENKGPGTARNLGMEKASGEYLLFIDSDCTLASDYLKNLNEHISTDSFDAFGGPDSSREDFTPFLKAVDFCLTSFIGTGGARGTKGLKVTKFYPRSFNMGIKRTVFQKIGGMGKIRHGQDIEFSNRIIKAGFRVKFLPDVVVYHKRRTSLKKFFKQIFNWGVARINLGRIDRQMFRFVHLLPSIVLILLSLSFVILLLSPELIIIVYGEAIIILTVFLLIFVQASLKYGSIKTGLLSVVVFITQIIAYGSGVIYSLIRGFFSREKQVAGFTKNYYR